MKILSGFTVLNINGSDRVSFTFDVVDEEGNLKSDNNKKSFFAVDEELKKNIDGIRSYISTKKLDEAN